MNTDNLPEAVREQIEFILQRLAEKQAVRSGRSDAAWKMQMIAQFGVECAEAAMRPLRAEVAMLRSQLRAAEDGRTVDRMNAEAAAQQERARIESIIADIQRDMVVNPQFVGGLSPVLYALTELVAHPPPTPEGKP